MATVSAGVMATVSAGVMATISAGVMATVGAEVMATVGTPLPCRQLRGGSNWGAKRRWGEAGQGWGVDRP